MLFTVLATAALTSASAVVRPLAARGSCNEGAQKICYGTDGGEAQHVDPEDVQYVADYLRFLDDHNEGLAKMWTMPKEAAIGQCAEWALPVPKDAAGTVLALAKHTNGRIASSIRFNDLAAAIDGNDGIKGCGTNGGQRGVKANTSDPIYSSDDYKKSGAKPEGIVLKIVKAPSA